MRAVDSAVCDGQLPSTLVRSKTIETDHIDQKDNDDGSKRVNQVQWSSVKHFAHECGRC